MSQQTKFFILLSFVLSSSSITLAQAQRQSSQNSKPSLARPDAKPPCLLCSWNVAPEIAESSHVDGCDELLPAACLDSKSEYKIKPMFDRIEKKLKEMVKTAQGKAALQMGFKNFDDAMIKSLAKEGYALKKDISEKAKKYILENDYKNYVEKKEIFEVAAECAEDKKAFDGFNSYSQEGIEKLKQYIQQVDEFESKYQNKASDFFLKDIPGLLNKIGTQCKALETGKDELTQKNLLTHPLVLKLRKVCSDRNSLRTKAVHFYLRQDDPNTKIEIAKFVQENRDVLELSLSSLKQIEESSTTETELTIYRRKATDKAMQLYGVCNAIEERLDGGPGQIKAKLLDVMSTARTSVEHLIDQIYTPERKSKVREIHDTSKREAYAIIQKVTNDPQKLARIRDTYKRMVFTWLEKPTTDRYIKDKETGIEVLKLNLYNPNDIWSQAFTGDLSFFTDVNAFYIPDTQYGAEQKPLSVTMQPIFMEVLDENPHAFLSVMAHEVGHNLGPIVTEINNYSLKEEYKPLLECLASSDSIRMQYIQADETVADVISAEVMAQLLLQIPADRRKAAVYASMQTFCKFLDEGDKEMSLFLTATHPESILRVSGIFGGNKSLRSAMSCEKDAKQFRTCSLKGAE